MSPMMLQYLEVKKQYPDHILMYRLGDFYEMFFDDAKTASRELDLTLTGRDCGEEERAPMCGVPYHAYEGYVSKLVEKGYKVAICEQMEDPATAKGIVKRDVVRIITPGTVTIGGALDEKKNNYLASVCVEKNAAGVAFCDVAENEMHAIRLTALSRELLFEAIINEFAKFMPSELICNLSEIDAIPLAEFIRRDSGNVTNFGETDLFSEEKRYLLVQQFAKSEEALGLKEDDAPLACAASALIGYLLRTQKTALKGLTELVLYDNNQYLSIDANSRRNLELTETMRHGEKRGSLLWVLDKTRTGAGARLLRRMIEQPLTNPHAIEKRQSAVREFYEKEALREDVRETLSRVQDIERTLSRILFGNGNAKDLVSLARTASLLPDVAEELKGCEAELKDLFQVLKTEVLPETEELADLLTRAVRPEPPFSVREGGFIAPGFNRDLDELNEIMTGSREYLARIEAREKEETGIKTMRIGYNRVFGYYFEVSRSQIDLVPNRYIRKQTLVNGERFITEELKDLETRILGAKDRAVALEYELFTQLCDRVKEKAGALQTAAKVLALADVYASLAEVARRNGYVCPEITFGDELILKDARHPVVERMTDGFFVPNDCDLNTSDKRMAIITGPNMAGKSTYMRQCALIVIMAQMGSFVPAKEAAVGIVDKIFTRVGASDDLGTGQSTFMLEMTEVANILKNATKKSLIIYDEIGRGTSTYDGMSIAKAVVEYTAGKKCGAKTLFATHYHELSVLENEIPGVRNFNIAAKKRGDGVIFLRKIVPGSTDDSYGIEVASLAGVPAEVIRRAKEILAQLEKDNPERRSINYEEVEVLPILAGLRDEIVEELKNTNVDTLTPIEALGKLYELTKKAKEI